MLRSDTSIRMGSLTYPSRVQSATHSWRMVLLRSITGFRTQVGSPFRCRSEEDLSHALWLMRLSYLRYALKTATDPHKLFEQESEQLRLSPRFKSLLEP